MCRKRLHLIYYEHGDLKQQLLNRYLSNKASPFVSRGAAERVGGSREVTGGHLTLRVPETTVELQDFRPLFGQHQPRVQHACNTVSNTLLLCLGRFFMYMHFEYFLFLNISTFTA